jgi:hypothetical protein
MSNVGAQLDVLYPPNLVPPTFYTNVAQLGMVGDEEVCINFCIRSPDKPMLQANLQCRIISSISNLKRLNQGLAQLLSQHEQVRAHAEAQAQAAQQKAVPAAPKTSR